MYEEQRRQGYDAKVKAWLERPEQAELVQSLKASQGVVSVVKPQSYVREIITLANLHRLLPVYNTEQDALAGERLPAVG